MRPQIRPAIPTWKSINPPRNFFPFPSRVAGPGAIILLGVLLSACQPTVRIQAPEEPITINLNVKLDAEVRVKLEEQAQEDIAKNKDIF